MIFANLLNSVILSSIENSTKYSVLNAYYIKLSCRLGDVQIPFIFTLVMVWLFYTQIHVWILVNFENYDNSRNDVVCGTDKSEINNFDPCPKLHQVFFFK